MDRHHLQQMLRALKPALKKRQRAGQILNQYWRNKIAIVWETTDVHRAANELEVALTEKEAMTVLETLHRQHNPQLGLRWADIMAHIEVQVLGRKLTQREVKEFVKRGKLFIQR